MEIEGWEKIVEEEDSDMANGLKLEVTIEEAIVRDRKKGSVSEKEEEGEGFRTVRER